jgi:hypothetical protein
MEEATLPGKKVRDISELLDIFQAQEGIIEHIIGKTGNGKTYYATLRAWELLMQGNVVYTTWKMILPDFYDERNDFQTVFWKTVFGKKQFYRYNLKENWKWINIDRPDLKEYIASLTDCFVFLDEGQDIFSSHDRIDGQARRTITRTRHMRKTLIIVSQRAQAVDTNARANVSHYYKCVKQIAWFWPFRPFFRVYTTEEMDDANIPVWEEHIPYSNGKVWRAPIYRQYFANKKIYALYNSWYLRDGIEKSQEVNFEAYELSTSDKIKTLGMLVKKGKQKKEVNRPYKSPSPHLTALKEARQNRPDSMLELAHEEEAKDVAIRDSEREPLVNLPVNFEERKEEIDYAQTIPRRERIKSISNTDAREHRPIQISVPHQAERVGSVRPKKVKEKYREKIPAGAH